MPVHPEAVIHPTAIVEDGAVVGPGCRVGPYCVLGPEVELAEPDPMGGAPEWLQGDPLAHESHSDVDVRVGHLDPALLAHGSHDPVGRVHERRLHGAPLGSAIEVRGGLSSQRLMRTHAIELETPAVARALLGES